MSLKQWGNGDVVTLGKAWALDERGRRRTEVPVKTIGGRSVVEIGSELKTLWWRPGLGDRDAPPLPGHAVAGSGPA